MRKFEAWAAAWIAWLCRMFEVTPDSLRRGRRGNLPPEQGGFAAY
jgi:hypothetical protein